MLKIRDLSIPTPLLLAPLAGYSDLPFRQLCHEYGAGLCVSEMISCHGLVYQQKKTLRMLASSPEERPVSFQLFGADALIMAQGAEILNDYSPDALDINMGCPVKKVTKKGAGAALMAQPRLAESIIKEIIAVSTSPVTVKIRSGVNSSDISCVDFAKMIEDCGAAAVTVHGRTWAQGFTGRSDWQHIAAVKKSVSIPVIGNGDISTHTEAIAKINDGYCDGVMIGRAALGNPWVFNPLGRPDSLVEIAFCALRHLKLIQQYQPVDRMLAAIKNQLGRYFKELQGSSRIRKIIFDCTSFSSLYSFIETLKEGSFPLPENTKAPSA